MAKKNDYDVSRDLVVARPLVKAYDPETCEPVSVGSEGGYHVAICVRRMDAEDGTHGQYRVALTSCYIAKRAGKRLSWVVPEEGKPELRTPEEGDLVLGGALKRLDPRIAAASFPEFARYAARVAEKLAA